ncbi:hypothetical protein GWI33_015519 [Rhynchophorus ferrugineus]|uniref:Uncharacterized protein n=1 Tax=Rhynchophorus ferrugineus TaxID=354439 RepID=A0A834I2Z5_RHYFE|nr:hypothetical protein GWI33_015519 [Rhynchophorus ferrugineus]
MNNNDGYRPLASRPVKMAYSIIDVDIMIFWSANTIGATMNKFEFREIDRYPGEIGPEWPWASPGRSVGRLVTTHAAPVTPRRTRWRGTIADNYNAATGP